LQNLNRKSAKFSTWNQ